MDSSIGDYIFLTKSSIGDKILAVCKMDDICEVTAEVDDNDAILSVSKLAKIGSSQTSTGGIDHSVNRATIFNKLPPMIIPPGGETSNLKKYKGECNYYIFNDIEYRCNSELIEFTSKNKFIYLIRFLDGSDHNVVALFEMPLVIPNPHSAKNTMFVVTKVIERTAGESGTTGDDYEGHGICSLEPRGNDKNLDCNFTASSGEQIRLNYVINN